MISFKMFVCALVLQNNKVRTNIAIKANNEVLSIVESKMPNITPQPSLFIIGLNVIDGSNVKDIIEKTGVAIDFEDDGTTIITANNQESAQKAIDMIMDLVWEPSK